MAQPITITKSKDHRKRKNPHSADTHAKLRVETNGKRPKQRWVIFGSGGYWTREAA